MCAIKFLNIQKISLIPIWQNFCTLINYDWVQVAERRSQLTSRQADVLAADALRFLKEISRRVNFFALPLRIVKRQPLSRIGRPSS